MAERVGFEPTVPCSTPDFESGTFDHSATSPGGRHDSTSGMISIRRLLAGLSIFLLASCGDSGIVSLPRPLPFPTPAQHDLVVLTSQGPLTYFTDASGTAGGLE